MTDLMMFQQLLDQVAGSECRDVLPHALLLSGPEHGVLEEQAAGFVKELLKADKPLEQHPDVHIYLPDGKTQIHTLETIRQLKREVWLTPYEAPWKVFILHQADKMPLVSQNALLKTLEEPTPQTLLLLLSSHPSHLLATIGSRCQHLCFGAVSEKKGERALPQELLCLLMHVGQEQERDFRKEAALALQKEEASILFESILFWYRDRLLLELTPEPAVEGVMSYLHFPHYLTALSNSPLLPFDQVEQAIARARLAHSRSIKLPHCLELLFLHLQQIAFDTPFPHIPE